MLEGFQAKPACVARPLVELHARRAFAFNFCFDPQQDFGIDRLRTDIAAKQAPSDGSHQKEGISGNNEEKRQIEHVLRPEYQAEEIELPLDDMKEHCLAPVPLQPAGAVENELGEPHHTPAPVGKQAGYAARIDLLVLLVEALGIDDGNFDAGVVRLGH